jgi:hypothetical protein
MAGLVPAIHAFWLGGATKAWMPVTFTWTGSLPLACARA